MLTDVPGFLVGHATMEMAITGCTVILCPPETAAGVEVLGGWPATREMAILSPLSSSPYIHAILFTGRSVYGLAAADGVVRFIEEQRGVIPQVPGVVINDLAMGSTSRRPGPEEGYAACREATSTFARGSVGAGTGATVGKGRGPDARMKGRIGSASRTFGDGGVVAAMAVVNAVGDVYDRNGKIIAGAHDSNGMHIDFPDYVDGRPLWPTEETGSNTTLVAVATNAALKKTQCSIVAHMAQAGFPRAISPIYTPWDGDTVIVASSGNIPASDFTIGVLAAEVVADSIRDSVRQATSLGGVPDLSTPGTRSANDPAWSTEPANS
ncbi:MAG: P1 family peptidase, partial [Chloroflexota bacterium]|nr:P1 family peptidase [Chloroflexota bacterium]